MENSPPHAVPIVVPDKQNKFLLEEKSLEEILLQKDIADLIAIPVTVTGAFRQGKSFLLDFCIRYLESVSNSSDQETEETDDWLGDENSPLGGFSWRGGSQRDTTGILMWSKIFKVDLPTGEKAAVILLDTQGTFDDKSTVRECATVFALSTMLSSIQIFNLFHNLREDHLQHLELFTEYGKLFGHDIGHKPFQKLQFLIRDWSWPYEKNYGPKGGQALLEDRLKITDEHAPEQRSLRNNINSCFTDIQCFLMPHPGSKVASNSDFDGRLSDIDDEFKTYLKQFIPMLLSVENLVQKEIGGQKIKVRELVVYLKWYMELFNGDDLPEPKSMLLATAEANILSVVATAREYFNQCLWTASENNEPYLTPQELEEEYVAGRTEAIDQFDEKPKMGGDDLVERYRTILIEGIDSDYNRFKIHNGGKAEASNQLALAAGKESYSRNMASAFESSEPCLSMDKFNQMHEKYAQLALAQFRNNCKAVGDELSNKHQETLEQDILVEHNRLFALNKNKVEANNRAVIVASKEVYHKKMAEVIQNANETFFSSEMLEQMHVQCKTESIEYFNRRYIPNGEKFPDENKINLEKSIDTECDQFKLLNRSKAEAHNQLGFSSAKEAYNRQMTIFFNSSPRHFGADEFEQEHQKCKTTALELFTNHCKNCPHEFSETYLIKLDKEIETDRNWFQTQNECKAKVPEDLTEKLATARGIMNGGVAGAVLGIASAVPGGALIGIALGAIMGRRVKFFRKI